MTMEPGYVDLLVAHQPGKPRNREELEEMTALLESLAMNEIQQSPAIERFIETLTVLIMHYEQEMEPGPISSHNGVLQYLMEEHKVRQVDLIPSSEQNHTSARSCRDAAPLAKRRRPSSPSSSA